MGAKKNERRRSIGIYQMGRKDTPGISQQPQRRLPTIQGGFTMMTEWQQLYDEELKLYDENENAHFECTTCHELMPNAAPPFIPLLIAIECFECYSKRMEASR